MYTHTSKDVGVTIMERKIKVYITVDSINKLEKYNDTTINGDEEMKSENICPHIYGGHLFVCMLFAAKLVLEVSF